MGSESPSIDLNRIATEQRNPVSEDIDSLSTLDLVGIINQEDQLVAAAVQQELAHVAEAVDLIVAGLQAGGRLVYIGAGTSGRLGVLDASEIPPTFNAPPELVVGLIAGGDHALRHPVEHVEDQPESGKVALESIDFSATDVLVGIAASGRTPFVLGALDHANGLGAVTIGLSNSPDSPISERVSVCIVPQVGPEVVTGSTRMKAGTSQKLVLNMLTTATMVKLGKTYGNLMVDVQPTNAKLRERAIRIVMSATNANRDLASRTLADAQSDVKTAIVAIARQVSVNHARELLAQADGVVKNALESTQS